MKRPGPTLPTWLAMLAAVTTLTLLMPAASRPALAAGTGPACDATTPRPDRLSVACALDGRAQRLVFTARFSGSHDDTTASLQATLDGQALGCDAGSKTSLSGEEEGDVELVCRVTLPARDGAARRLQVLLAWHHAQYTGFGLAAADQGNAEQVPNNLRSP